MKLGKSSLFYKTLLTIVLSSVLPALLISARLLTLNHTLLNTGGEDWALSGEAVQQITATLTTETTSYLIYICVVSSLIAIFTAGGLIGPIRRLQLSVERFRVYNLKRQLGSDGDQATVGGSQKGQSNDESTSLDDLEQLRSFSSDEIGSLASSFTDMANQIQLLLTKLEQQVAERTRRLEIAATLGERMNTILKMEQLLVEVVNQIKDNFNYYHTHIYLIDDEREKLVVAEGTGAAGAEMKAKRHSIPLDAPISLVARAARTGQVIRVDNVREASDWLPNVLLPNTHSEMAVPIILEGEVVGVLDVQQDKIAGMDEGDANLLRSLANQVAVAIRNARQFARVETALAEARTAQARYLEQAWGQVKTVQRQTLYHYQRPGTLPLNSETQNQSPLAVPIQLQNQTIGMIQLHETEHPQPWNERELALVKAVAEQIAQVAENLRLFEETRERAGREQAIREITDKLRTAPNLDTLLETAARELGQRLRVRHTVMELGLEPNSSPGR